MLWWWVCGLALGAGAQKSFEKVENGPNMEFTVRWVDHAGENRRAQFALPTQAIRDDKEYRTSLPRKELNTHMAQAVRAYGQTVKRARVRAQVSGGQLSVQVVDAANRKVLESTLEGALQARDTARDAWLADNAFTELEHRDGLTFDHARLAYEYADDLRPVAEALRKSTDSERAFVDKALSFVQAIPYEARKRKGGDPGYRRPVAMLARNRGDCDSKSVLFLALVRAVYPEMPLSFVYVPGHALTGVGIAPIKGDRTFAADDVTFVYAEPVGPALHPLGEPARENRKAGKKGETRRVPS